MWLINNTHTHTHTHNDPTVSLAFFIFLFTTVLSTREGGEVRKKKDVPEISGLESGGAVFHGGAHSGFSHSAQ